MALDPGAATFTGWAPTATTRRRRPPTAVAVDGFWIDRYAGHEPRSSPASSRTTGYVTVAERPLDPAAFPGAPAENLVARLARLHAERRARSTCAT